MKSNIKAFILILFSLQFSFAQIGALDNFWQPIGPNSMPDNYFSNSAAGIGPIEFIRVNPIQQDLLLAGSLNGGLFYSENGGEFWNNAGSDAWDYSTCAWADFHPERPEVWFACSNESGDNGGPGKIGEKGGLMRTLNNGLDWDLIADLNDLGGSYRTKIFGTRFHPKDPNLLIVLTSNGLYYTEQSLSQNIQWKKIPNLNGWAYDLVFLNGEMYVTHYENEFWSLLKFNQDDLQRYMKIKEVLPKEKGLQYVTLQSSGDFLFILKVYSNGSDAVWKFDPSSSTEELLLDRQQVSFGSGRTFAVNPYHPEEFYLGNGIRVRKWKPPYKRSSTMDGDYHPDVEFISFDPFDSLKVYMATHGGVYISNNEAEKWEYKSNNLGNAEVMGLSVSVNDPNQIVIGTYHDGSVLRADFNKNGEYVWRTVNGGDGLIPLTDPHNNATVYTSNQYTSGGLYYSSDTINTKPINLHAENDLKSAGWEMAATLNGVMSHLVYFNSIVKTGENKGNIDICRLAITGNDDKVAHISDFNASHKLNNYKVYGLYTSKFHANTLIAYVLDYTKDDKGKSIIIHRLYRNDNINDNPLAVKKSWVEIQPPIDNWIGDVEIDAHNKNLLYISYVRGNDQADDSFDKKEMVFAVKYKNSTTYRAKRRIDISRNIPFETAGKHNLVYTNLFGGGLFFATKTGVYFGTKKVLKGRGSWFKIGYGLPHCKIYGLDYNEKHNTITVGLFGRGVWQYYLED